MIELSRDITFGQYINNGSTLTRMDPRAKLICAVLLIALVSYIGSFIAFGIFLSGCIILQWMSRISVAYVLRGFRAFAIFLIFILSHLAMGYLQHLLGRHCPQFTAYGARHLPLLPGIYADVRHLVG